MLDWLRDTLTTFKARIEAALLEELEKQLDEMYEQNLITQAILGAMEYRGFYDAGKYLDGDIWERIKPLILAAITTRKEQIG